MLRHFVPSRWLHHLAPLKRLSPVDLPSANGFDKPFAASKFEKEKSEIEKYHKENNQELIVVLSTFDTDEKGGDGGFNPNDTYVNWQWYLVKTAEKKSWEIINRGY